ncbi:MAG TPA: tetratricopeptide repeat protein [Candidatus Wunengus sp. YC65]|uniref:tetratricopeptide repeat protein n=1 Tax=Candidatus Wunengus sp. YC65 TaxID=3367701 RepID=UPI0040282970
MNKKIRLTLFSLITVLPVLIYLNSLGNTFVYDDYLTITNNYFIREWRYLSAFFSQKYFAISNELTYRPVVTLSYFVDYALWQLRPWGYHLTNLIIHTLNVYLVYFTAYHLFKNRITAFISCLLFSVHPIFSEAVNAVSYREDLLSATFLLVAFILFIKYNESTNRRYFIIWYALSLLTYLLAMLSKETAVVLPFLILSYDLIFQKNHIVNLHNRIRRLVANYAGYIATGGFYLFLRFYLIHNPGESVEYPGNSIFVNFIMMTKVLGYYLKLLFIPAPLNADYVVPLTYSPADGAFIVSAILLIITAILLVKKCRLSRIWIFSTIWFFVTLLPVLNIIPINNIIAERYLYIPGIGFTMLLGSILTSKPHQSRFSKADLMGINASLVSVHPPPLTPPTRGGEKTFPPPVPLTEGEKGGGGRSGGGAELLPSFNETSNYKLSTVNSKYTWTRLFRIVSITLVCLLFTWSTVSRNRIWLNEFTFSTETIRRSPASFRIYNDLGFFYYHKGLNDAAIQAFKDSIRIRYNQPKAHCNLGAAYSLKGLSDEAIEELKVAIQLRNQYPEAHNNLGILYKRKGLLNEAVNEYIEALKFNPYYADAHNNLGSALIDQGRLDEALSEIEKAVKIRMNFALAHYNIAVVYFKKGQINEAYNKLLEACQLDPTNADVHISLGVVYLDHFHDKEKALHHIKEALRLNPKHKQAEEMKKTVNKLTSPENRP